MATQRQRAKKRAPPKRAKRSLLASRPLVPLRRPRLELEPHHVDIAGLALIAVGVFLTGVAYLHWAGGALGAGAITSVRFALGVVGYAVPPALVLSGALVLVRELRAQQDDPRAARSGSRTARARWKEARQDAEPAASSSGCRAGRRRGRPMRTGVVCLTGALTLAIAAGALGLGPARAPSHEHYWRAATFESRGGILGQAELWAASHLLSPLGAQILAVFLLVAGLILVSGATFAGIVRATGTGVAGTSRVLKRSGGQRAQRPRWRDALARRRVGEAAGLFLSRRSASEARTLAWHQGSEAVGLSLGRRRAKEAGTLAGRPATEAAKTAAGAAQPVQEAVDPGSPSALEPSPYDPAADTENAERVVLATHVEAPPIQAHEGSDQDRATSGTEALSHPAPGAVPHALAGAGTDLRATAERAGEAAANPPGDDPRDDERDGGQVPVAAGHGDLTPAGRYRASVTEDPDFQWSVPGARFLTRSTGEAARPDTAGQEQVAGTLVETLGHFGIEAKVIGRVTGPHITRYELRLAPGTKVSKIAALKDDLAYALAATDIRILAPIPGKQAVGVEVPNARRRIVHLGDVFQEPPEDWSPLTVWLGKDIAGRAIGADLAKMPHLLVAGTTGAGKSACVNAMLSSILLRATPHELRLVLVDPKQVELNHYESIPHLLTPVITSPRMAANALQNLVKEMEQRYGTMSLARTRSLPELNRSREKRGEPPLPYVLCVIDELADLMMVAPADVEDSIIRLAQKARAVGIHLVLATQSPRVDVITGMIKANVPSRIAFAVSSQTDSRVILDHNGAESLLGQGDMLFSPVGSSKLQRIQGAYIDEEQVAHLTDAWRRQGEPELREELLEEVPSEDDAREEEGAQHADEDPLLQEAIALVAQMGTASTSMLQRRLRLGYTRAGRLIDMLERRGIISGYEGSKPRQVLIAEADVPRILSHLAEAEGGGATLNGDPAGGGGAMDGAGPTDALPGACAQAGREAPVQAPADVAQEQGET